MLLTAALDEWRFAQAAHSPRSIAWNDQKVGAFIAWCTKQDIQSTDQVTASHVHRFLASLPADLSTYTRRGYAQSVKAFLNYCVREDLMSEKLPKRISMPKVTERVIEVFTPDQIKRLFAACEREVQPAMRARDRALLAVLLDTGLRADELCSLTLDRVHFDRDDTYLHVLGKGRRERQVGLGSKSRAELHRYIYRYRDAPSILRYVFVGHKGMRLGPNGLDQMLYRLRDWAGPERFAGVRVSAHTFRHTMAVSYLERGGDVYVLSRLLGHSNITTTELYLKAFRSKSARRGLSVFDSF